MAKDTTGTERGWRPGGWSRVANGAIRQHVDGVFDGLVLADKNLRYQQNLKARRIALAELPTNRWPVLKALLTQIVRVVESARPGSDTIVPAAEGP